MTDVKTIRITRGAMHDVAQALNAEASHFNDLRHDPRFANRPDTVSCFAEKSADNRFLSRLLVCLFDGAPEHENVADSTGPLRTRLEKWCDPFLEARPEPLDLTVGELHVLQTLCQFHADDDPDAHYKTADLESLAKKVDRIVADAETDAPWAVAPGKPDVSHEDRVAIENAVVALRALATQAQEDALLKERLDRIATPGGYPYRQFADNLAATAARYPTRWAAARARDGRTE